MKKTQQNLVSAIVSSIFGILAYFLFRHGPATVSPVLSAFFCAAGFLFILCLIAVSKKCSGSRAYINAFYEYGSVSVTAASCLIVAALFIYVFSDTGHALVYLFTGICFFSITMMISKIFLFIRLYLNYFRHTEKLPFGTQLVCEPSCKSEKNV